MVTGSVALQKINESLSVRDWQVLRLIHQHRYLTTTHVEGFVFHDHATALTGARVCRRVLRRLAEQRIIQPLDRRIGGVRAGSASYVWQVGPVGYRLLGVSARKRPHEPSALFLDHCLAVAAVHLELVRADRTGRIALDVVQSEPDCWRSYTGMGGAREMLKPDLYAVTADPSDPDYELRWFIEVDLGTEHPKRLLAKCRRYLEYAASTTDQSAGGLPLVVWAMTTTDAAEQLEAAIAADPALATAAFRTTTQDDLTALIAGDAL